MVRELCNSLYMPVRLKMETGVLHFALAVFLSWVMAWSIIKASDQIGETNL